MGVDVGNCSQKQGICDSIFLFLKVFLQIDKNSPQKNHFTSSVFLIGEIFTWKIFFWPVQRILRGENGPNSQDFDFFFQISRILL